MPHKENNPAPKPAKGFYLAQSCIKDIKEVLEDFKGPQRLEMVEHFWKLFDEIENDFQNGNNEGLESYQKRAEDLLKRYGRTLKPYQSKYFYKLFTFPVLLHITGYYTTEEFNALQNQEYLLSQEDVSQWLDRVRKFLHADRYYYYLERDPEFETTVNTEISGTREESDKEMTEARRLLAIYYILKVGFNIEPKQSHSAAALARLSHLLLGKPLTDAQNSSIYKKYKKMPEVNSGSVLVKDLRYIRQYFEELDLQNILELIDRQIKSTLKKVK